MPPAYVYRKGALHQASGRRLARMAQPNGVGNHGQVAIGTEEVHHVGPPNKEVEPNSVQGQCVLIT